VIGRRGACAADLVIWISELVPKQSRKESRTHAAGVVFVLFWIYYQAQLLLAKVHLIRVIDRDSTAPHAGA
jgi:hypothetical protein